MLVARLPVLVFYVVIYLVPVLADAQAHQMVSESDARLAQMVQEAKQRNKIISSNPLLQSEKSLCLKTISDQLVSLLGDYFRERSWFFWGPSYQISPMVFREFGWIRGMGPTGQYPPSQTSPSIVVEQSEYSVVTFEVWSIARGSLLPTKRRIEFAILQQGRVFQNPLEKEDFVDISWRIPSSPVSSIVEITYKLDPASRLADIDRSVNEASKKVVTLPPEVWGKVQLKSSSLICKPQTPRRYKKESDEVISK